MKIFLLKLAGAMALITFMFWTKYWYAIIFDGPHKWMYGFPFPNMSDALHTSMALHIFVLAGLVDFSIYFLVWWGMFYALDRWLIPIRLHRSVVIAIFGLAGLSLALLILLLSVMEVQVSLLRPYDFEVVETYGRFIWQDRPVRDLKID
ncbi:MAG: hypothetical protein R2824_30520 [Saprospiraceae bacterium]|nr:hypothetical protein [Lewinella sp.]